MGLGTAVDIYTLPDAAIRNLAPLLLGSPAWAQISGGPGFLGWRDFRKAVELEFGLSEAQEKATFYSTVKGAG